MRNKILLILTMLMTSVVLTGCWDSVEINERHVILDLAIDKYNGDNSDEDMGTRVGYEVTYMIPDIAKLSGESSLAEDVKTAMVVKSPTLSKSIDDAEARTQNTLTFTHTKALIFGEDLIRDKKLFKAAIDSLIRNNQIGKGTNLLVVQGKASDINKSNNYQNPITGLYIMKYFNNSERSSSYAKQQVLGELVKEINDTDVSTIPVIKKSEENTFNIEGAAVIKDYEFIDWLDKDEVRGLLFIDGSIEGVPIIVNYQDQELTYEIEKEKSRIRFNEENEPKVVIDIIVKGNIIDYVSSNEKNTFSEEKMNDIAGLIQQEVNAQVKRAIDKSQSMNTDFIGIGLQMYRQCPKLWDKYSSHWNDGEYKDVPIELNTKVVIDNTGTLE